MTEESTEGGYFSKALNDLLVATEQIAYRMEEGLAALWTGELPHHTTTTTKSAESDHDTHGKASTAEPNEWDTADDDDDDDPFQHSPLEGIAENVLGDIVQGQKRPESLVENFHAFRHAITWSEPFILGLVVFQIVMFVLSMWVARKNKPLSARMVVMVFIGGTVRLAERLNKWGARHWKSFSTQNYFDRRGVFMSVMLAAPLLLDCLIMLILFVREAGQLLVTVKTAQLQQKMKQQKEEQEQQQKKGQSGKKKQGKKESKKDQ